MAISVAHVWAGAVHGVHVPPSTGTHVERSGARVKHNKTEGREELENPGGPTLHLTPNTCFTVAVD